MCAAREPNPMRIVLSTAGTYHIFDLARELEARGLLRKVYSTFHWGRLKREAIPRAKVETLPLLHPAYMLAGRLKINIPRTLARRTLHVNSAMLDHWVARRLPECEIFSSVSCNGLLSGRTAKQQGARYICDRGCSHIRFQHETLEDEYKRWKIDWMACYGPTIAREEQEYAEADAIVVPSQFSRSSFVQMGIAASKVHVLPLGVNLQKFYAEGAPDDSRFDVLFAGQICFRKGIPYLIESFLNFKHQHKRLRLAGSVNAEIHEYLRHNLEDDVELLGMIPQAQLRSWMSRSHALVLPSVEDGFGMVLNQAMACGCVPICTENTGGSDLFTDGVEGFIVPVRDPVALKNKFELLADSPALRLRMSLAAQERVKHLGGWHEYGNAFVELAQQLLAH